MAIYMAASLLAIGSQLECHILRDSELWSLSITLFYRPVHILLALITSVLVLTDVTLPVPPMPSRMKGL